MQPHSDSEACIHYNYSFKSDEGINDVYAWICLLLISLKYLFILSGILHYHLLLFTIKFKIMKKIFFFTAIAFLTLSSCRKESTTLAKDQTLAQSQAQTNASSSGGAVPFSNVYTVKVRAR